MKNIRISEKIISKKIIVKEVTYWIEVLEHPIKEDPNPLLNVVEYFIYYDENFPLMESSAVMDTCDEVGEYHKSKYPNIRFKVSIYAAQSC